LDHIAKEDTLARHLNLILFVAKIAAEILNRLGWRLEFNAGNDDFFCMKG